MNDRVKCWVRAARIDFDTYTLEVDMDRNDPDAVQFMKDLLSTDKAVRGWYIYPDRIEVGKVDVDRLHSSVKTDDWPDLKRMNREGSKG